ncbi:hypothetical protein QR680_004066 [Steinernema hermaphroditum]|uniref:Uncharacterized protein n=1 Tax=Steinernema hermaphroditum TaxID=289476 RepID=A0AA39HNL3_9BILA|nr:hypothetical protein QR680_004066 [Steinernema hermaphroditum]
MTFESTKCWDIPRLSGAPVIAGNELYLLDMVDGAIDRINMDNDEHTALQKDVYDKNDYGFEYLTKVMGQILIFWSKDLKFYSAPLKLCRDGTLKNPFRLDGPPVFRGQEGDDEPFEFNETGIFQVTRSSSDRPIVQFTNLETQFVSRKIKFPDWSRTDYSEGDCAFFATPGRLFGIDYRHLYLCSIDPIDGTRFTRHYLHLAENLDDVITFENHNMCRSGDYLYIVYSDNPSLIRDASPAEEQHRRVEIDDSDNDEADESQEEVEQVLPMILRIHIRTYSVEKLNLIWPQGAHRPSVSCYISVEDSMICLSGRCSLSQEDCEDTHIFRFEEIFLAENGAGESLESQSPKREDTSPAPKKRRIAESPTGSSPSDEAGPADRCEDCRRLLNENYACVQCGNKCCPTCLVNNHQHDRQIFHRVVAKERVTEILEEKRAELQDLNDDFIRACGRVGAAFRDKNELVAAAQEHIESIADEQGHVREDELNNQLELMDQWKAAMEEITQNLQEAVDDASQNEQQDQEDDPPQEENGDEQPDDPDQGAVDGQRSRSVSSVSDEEVEEEEEEEEEEE